MKRLLLATLCLWASGLFAQSGINLPALSITGQPLQNSPVRVCQQNSTGNPCLPLAQIYSDWAETQPIIQPGFLTSPQGNIVAYAPVGRYDIQIIDTGNTYTYPNIIFPPAAAGGGGCGGSSCITSTGLTSGYVPVASGALTQVNSSIQDNLSNLVSTPENLQVGTIGATAGISLVTTGGTTSIGTISGDTGTGVLIPPSLSTGLHMALSDIVTGYSTILSQKFFGINPPGSVAGNLPGDWFVDTIHHHTYQCWATVGTAAPACTTVSNVSWMQVDGGGGSSCGGSNCVTTAGFTVAPGFNRNWFPSIQTSLYNLGTSALLWDGSSSPHFFNLAAAGAGSGIDLGGATSQSGGLGSDGNIMFEVPHNASFTVGTFAKQNGSNVWVPATNSDTNVPVFVVTATSIFDGNDLLTVGGTLGLGNGTLLACDTNVAAGHAVIVSSANAPKCTDGGASPSGVFVYGTAMATTGPAAPCSGSGSNYTCAVLVFPHWAPVSTGWSYHTTASPYTLIGSGDAGSIVIGPITVDTPAGNQWYDVAAQLVQSNTPSGCSGAASVAIQLDYTNATNGVHVTGVNNATLWNENSGSTINAGAFLPLSTSAPTPGQMLDMMHRSIYVTASTALKMSVYVTADTLTGCSPYPQVTFTPVVTKVLP